MPYNSRLYERKARKTPPVLKRRSPHEATIGRRDEALLAAIAVESRKKLAPGSAKLLCGRFWAPALVRWAPGIRRQDRGFKG